MSTNMGNLEKLGILVIVILVVVVGVVAITPKSATVEDAQYPDGQRPAALAPESLESTPVAGAEGGAPGAAPGKTDPWPDKALSTGTAVGSADAKTGQTATPTFRTVTIQRGDTLATIARRELGASSRYREILDANPGLPATKLTPGKEIKIPLATAATTPLPPASTPAGSSLASTPPSTGAGSQPGSTEPMPSGEKAYVVKSGDTLSSIAGRELGSNKRWPEIAKANESLLKGSTALKIGMKLRLPSGGESTALASRDAPRESASTGAHDYVVKAGDSLWSIARNEMGSEKSVAELKSANSDVLDGSDVLRIGMKLKIPSTK